MLEIAGGIIIGLLGYRLLCYVTKATIFGLANELYDLTKWQFLLRALR